MGKEKRKTSDRLVTDNMWDLNPDFELAVFEMEDVEKMPYMEDYYERMDRWSKEHQEIYLKFIMDATASEAAIFVPVYMAVENYVNEIERIKDENTDIHVKYGLTVFRERPENITFAQGEYFTESSEAFLNKVKDIVFTGGSPEGYEDIDSAVEEGIRNLENNSPEGANRGIVLFSGSQSFSDDLVNFTNISGCPNRGLRFAVGYLGSYQYGGVFKIVDKDGELAGDAKNNCAEFRCIDRLFKEDGLTEVKEQVRQLMIQTSVR